MDLIREGSTPERVLTPFSLSSSKLFAGFGITSLSLLILISMELGSVVGVCHSIGIDSDPLVKPPICSLLEVPLEIRVEIYQHLFNSAQLAIEPVYPSVPHCRFSICSCLFPWQIVNTCHQLRQEALGYLLAATTLQVASLPKKAELLPPVFLDTIPRIMIMNVGSYLKSPLDFGLFRSLQTLELHNIAVWCQYHDEEYLCGEDGNEIMFDLAMFNLKRNSLHLHQLCNKQDRLFNILLYCRYVVASVKQETLVSGRQIG